VAVSFYLAQIFNGLVNGAFIALMSLGLSIIFGMMRVVNFAHGAMYMLGAFVAFVAGARFGVSLWFALVFSILVVGGIGLAFERLLLRRLYGLDPAYNLLLTFGLTLIIEDSVRTVFGTAGAPFLIPSALKGAVSLGFIIYPKYRLFVVVLSLALCLGAWFLMERTRLGALVRAATERPDLLRCFGGNVPLLVSGTFFAAAGLAGVAGALAAPIRNISPFMGQEMIALTFAVVVTGGMGSIAGSVVMGFVVGVLSSLTAIWYPAGSTAIVYLLMLAVLAIRPGGVFQGVDISHFPLHYTPMTDRVRALFRHPAAALVALAIGCVLPLFVYPVLASDILLWGLFALGFDLLFAFAGLLSFGQAAYWGASAYLAGVLVSKFGFPGWVGFLIAVAAVTALGGALGFVIARKKGIYFSMITFAVAELVYFVVNELPAYTGGEDGLHDVARGSLFGLSLASDMTFYYVALAVVTLMVVFVLGILKSPFGLALTGARENERRMQSVGYNVYLLRVQAYALSAFIISVAGALYVFNHRFVSLEAVHWRASGEPIMMTLLGGAGTVFGPWVGSAMVLLIRNSLSTVTDNGSLILGCLFVVVVMLFRRGLLGESANWLLHGGEGWRSLLSSRPEARNQPVTTALPPSGE
jgi:branched-chain amino acid transport system permease protein